MKNKFLQILLILLFFTPGTIKAQTTWNIGFPTPTNVTATFSNDTLYIQGTGGMEDFSSAADQPWAIYGANIKAVVIEQGIVNIGNYAFSNCTNLVSVVIPVGVTIIGICAFQSCTNLVSVVIPEGVMLIYPFAFMGCSKLTSIVLPSTVTGLGEATFYGCSLLSSVTLLNLVFVDVAYVFLPPFSLFNTLYVPCCLTATYQQADFWKNFKTILPLGTACYSTDSINICKSELPYWYGDSIFTVAGVKEFHFTSQSGCDSIVTVTLTVSPCSTTTTTSSSSRVSNVQIEFSCPAGGVTFTYDLNTDCETDITLYHSPNKQEWFKARNVTGNIEAQTTGTGKKIIWNNAADGANYRKMHFIIETSD